MEIRWPSSISQSSLNEQPDACRRHLSRAKQVYPGERLGKNMGERLGLRTGDGDWDWDGDWDGDWDARGLGRGLGLGGIVRATAASQQLRFSNPRLSFRI